jgi:hypothetical protein
MRRSPALACPFCRERFGKEVQLCPECSLKLVPVAELPPTLSESEAESVDWERTPPEQATLGWRERAVHSGALLALSLAGLFVFMVTPWLRITSPYDASLSGWDLARGRIGWLWGGAVGQFLTVPLLLSRRNLMQLQGVRAIAAVFASLPLLEVLVLVARSPTHVGGMTFRYEWSWGSYLALALSATALVASARLGLANAGPPRSGERRREPLH